MDDAYVRASDPWAQGNGSCVCASEHFHGRDATGRLSCMEGACPAGYVEVLVNSSHLHPEVQQVRGCEACLPGSFSKLGEGCQQCLPGRFAAKSGSDSCVVCPSGHISEYSGMSMCSRCPAGQTEVNNQFCSLCPAGRISSGGTKSCTKCPEGFHASLPGSSNCDLCPAGFFAEEGGTRCVACSPGKVSGAGSRACRQCVNGTISQSSGMSACSACPAGMVEVNHQLCNACPVGHTSPKGANSCEQCSEGYHASQPGSSNCDLCPAGMFAEAGSARCAACGAGQISQAGSGVCSQCGAGRFARRSISCELCPAGTFSSAGAACQICPVGRVSAEGAVSCKSCEGFLIRAAPDAKRQTCQLAALDIVFATILWIMSASFVFFFLVGFGQVPIADVSAQGERLVATSSLAHFLLGYKWACAEVAWSGTGVKILDEGFSSPWQVTALSSTQLTICTRNEITMPLDTSMGYLHIKFPQSFLKTGLLQCPLLCWCLLFLVGSVAAALQLTWTLVLMLLALGLCTGFLIYGLRRRRGY